MAVLLPKISFGKVAFDIMIPKTTEQRTNILIIFTSQAISQKTEFAMNFVSKTLMLANMSEFAFQLWFLVPKQFYYAIIITILLIIITSNELLVILHF